MAGRVDGRNGVLANMAALAGAGLVLLASLGCSTTHAHTSLGLGVEVSVKPLQVSYDLPEAYKVVALSVAGPRSTDESPGKKEQMNSLELPVEMVEEHLAKLMEGSGAFREVVRMNGLSGQALHKRAKESGAGLLLEIQLVEPSLAYIEGTAGATWSGLIWIFAGWGTHWWHDQIFELNLPARVSLTDLLEGRSVGEETLLPVSCKEALSFHERSRGTGWYLLTLVWPPAWCRPNSEMVTASLLAASGTEVGRPVAEVLGRLERPEVIRLRLPSGKDLPVTFRFVSPREGTIPGKKIPLKLEVKLAKKLEDLKVVRLNGEIIWSAGKMKAGMPGESLMIEKDEIALKDGKAVLELSLHSQPEPVRVEIAKVPEVRLRPVDRGSGGTKSSP
ncbi:MAG: hypothetical protein O7H41_01745 [Planctomycetota bacterium]|nr:hypothetical protein [Planctomycetota bacterium]